MNNSEMVARWSRVMQSNYGIPQVALDHASGCDVWDVEGKHYFDLLGGIATNVLGHGHPDVVNAICEQAQKLSHVSNFFSHEPGLALAERLVEMVGQPSKVFFCNSGAEANEAVLKLSRLTGRTHVVAAVNAFHGRTLGALSLTGQPTKSAAFAPLPGGVTHVPYGEVDALERAVTDETAMVILEPIQGEAGVVPAPPGYLAHARRITASRGALLALDEVQTGMGRTGRWFAYQYEDVIPDVITMAKGLGAGLPLGAMIAVGDASNLFSPGSHGSTFGGNPIACAAGLAAINVIQREDLLANALQRGQEIDALADYEAVQEVRGRGLLRGIGLDDQRAAELQSSLMSRGFLTNAANATTLRIAPALNISADVTSRFVETLGELL